jgi:hypothetical protein
VSGSSANNDLPGEITHNKYALGALSYNPLPGRKTKKEEKVTARVPPSGVTKVVAKKHTIAKQNTTKKMFDEGTRSEENEDDNGPTEEGNVEKAVVDEYTYIGTSAV